MAYVMVIYPDEAARYPVPQIGAVFVVSKLAEIEDAHYGSFAYVRLQPLAIEDGACMVSIIKSDH